MSSFRHVQPLLIVEEATAAPQTSPSRLLLPSDGDGTADHEQRFVLFVANTVIPTIGREEDPSPPVVEVVLDTSDDGVHWVSATLQLPTTSPQSKASSTPNGVHPVGALGPYVRVRTLVSGAPMPTHTARILLGSNAPFRLQAVR